MSGVHSCQLVFLGMLPLSQVIMHILKKNVPQDFSSVFLLDGIISDYALFN